MAEYRTVKMSMWGDPFFESLEAGGKLLYIYLFTNPHVNNLGVMEISLRRISYETGLKEEETRELLRLFASQGKVLLEGQSILLLNFIKNQTFTSPQITVGLQNLIHKNPPPPRMAARLREKYPAIFTSARKEEGKGQGASMPPVSPLPALSLSLPEFKEKEEKEREEEEEGAGRTAPSIPCLEGREYQPAARDMAAWQEAYPSVNVPLAIAQARQWCLSNPRKLKTLAGARRFLTAWLAREEKSGGAVSLSRPAALLNPGPLVGSQIYHNDSL
ncbi:MAG: hypothetical protein LBJ14_09850 [Desulfarculales bacterium]|jgi:hypothetical protein|nr:hypothetical protein [Desulfarculales bacterium]